MSEEKNNKTLAWCVWIIEWLIIYIIIIGCIVLGAWLSVKAYNILNNKPVRTYYRYNIYKTIEMTRNQKEVISIDTIAIDTIK